MTHRKNDSVTIAATKSCLSRSTGYHIEADPTLPSQTNMLRGSRRPDPLAGIFDKKVVLILEKTPRFDRLSYSMSCCTTIRYSTLAYAEPWSGA